MKIVFLFMESIGGGKMILLLAVFSVLGAIYFIPSIIGHKRPNALLIFLVNLLTGWSVIGWFVALYLALRTTVTTLPIASAVASSLADELSKLRDLRDQGVLTQEEFDRQKNNLLT